KAVLEQCFIGIYLAQTLCFCVLPRDGAIIPLRDRKGKLSLVEWTDYNYREPEGYGTYAFGYEIEDPENNNVQFRNEEKLANGSVVGSYGYLEPNGDVFLVTYIADERGYRASFENPLKLSFLRPETSETSNHESKEPKEEAEKVEALSSLRIVTPDEGTPTQQQTSNNNHANQPLTHEESNAFYYPQNILGSAGFNQNQAGGTNHPSSKPQEPFSNFNSEKESNAFYYPQNILDSPDFNKPGNLSNQLIFQKNHNKTDDIQKIDSSADNGIVISNFQLPSKNEPKDDSVRDHANYESTENYRIWSSFNLKMPSKRFPSPPYVQRNKL
ncbi:uncharacterized protein LOC123312016, partial [Coccinella septempunctata]|uniref:uncharacterized protein LOC123312016 n=1 Tax=Coccinella septempunctata TaxID=41139 RepID=UPI001D095982